MSLEHEYSLVAPKHETKIVADPGLARQASEPGLRLRTLDADDSVCKAPRYDTGMTKSKIAISLPKDQIARVHREVRAGRAGSVSGYIARVLAEQERRESLRELLRDLIAQHGEPAAKDIKWAERALQQRRG
jgi:Arc/MetJ-type ribon-helix-helix transcriptional regulator